MACADNRRFVEAVLYRYRTSIPWRDLPVRFGHWKNVHQRFSRWAKPQSLNAMVAAASLRRSALADVKE